MKVFRFEVVEKPGKSFPVDVGAETLSGALSKFIRLPSAANPLSNFGEGAIVAIHLLSQHVNI